METARARLLSIGKLRIKVTPGAAHDEIFVAEEGGGEGPVLKVKVTAVAEKGRANEAVIALIADHFGLPKSHLHIVRGGTGRIKTLAYQA